MNIMDTISDGPSGSCKLFTSFLQNLRCDFLPEGQFSFHKSSSYAFYQCLKYKESEASKIEGKPTELPSKLIYVPANNGRLTESAVENNSFKSMLVNLYFDDYFKIICNAQLKESSFALHQSMQHESGEICKQSMLDVSNKDILSKLFSLSCDFQINTSSKQKCCFGFYQIIKYQESKLETKTSQEGPHPIAESESAKSIDVTVSKYQESKLETKTSQEGPHSIAESESAKSIDETVSEITDTENESNQLSDDENDWRRSDTEVFSFIGKNLSVEDFKEMYFHLDMDSLLEVEYLIEDENDWKFMLERKKHDIICNLCNSTLVANTPTIATHLRDTNHSNIVKDLSALFHPTYCAWSDDEESDDYEIAASAFYRSRALKEDMTLSDFKKTYTDMDMYNLLEILYLKDKHIWINMFEEKNYLYLCNLCDKYQLANFYEVQGHIRGLHHSSKVRLLEALYHPIYLKNSICKIESPDRNLNIITNLKTNVMIVNQKVETIKNNLLSNGYQREAENLQNTSEIIINGHDKPPTLNLFKTIYPALEIENLLKVQYSIDFKHKRFMIIYNGVQYFCNLCNNACLGNEPNVRTHIRGANHSKMLTNIVEMYDPKNSAWLKDLPSAKSVQNIKNSILSNEHHRERENLQNVSKNIKNGMDKPPTLNLFKTRYTALDIAHLITIQYSIDFKHKNFLIISNGVRYVCNLCNNASLGNESNVRTHIRGVNHSMMVKNIVEMYDPKNCVWLKDLQNAKSGSTHIVTANTQQNITAQNFRFEYINLGVKNFLKIKYKLNDSSKWIPMLICDQRYFGSYICNLCGSIKLNTRKQLRNHIRCVSHSKLVSNIFDMWHPKYCPKGLKFKGVQKGLKNESNLHSPNNSQNKTENEMMDIDEFKQTYIKLRIDKLMSVQYQLSNQKWEFMLNEENQRYFCNLCGNVQLGSELNIKPHIRGRYHSNKVRDLFGLQHPDIFPVGNNKKEESIASNDESDPQLKEFKKTYVDLEIDELLEVQYPQNATDWENMLTVDNDRYFCNLCGEVPLGTVPDVYTHIRGRNHSKKVQDLMDLYHPTYCNYADSEDSEDDEEASESADEESDYMLEEFKNTYVDLEIDELLEVQYPQNDTDGEYMLTVDNDRYFCNLCGEVPLGTVPDVYTHIRGRNHSKKVQDLMDLYHPTYCNYADSEDSEDDEEASESSDEESDSMLEEFKKTYVDLEIDELLEVQYPQNDTDGEYMLTVDNDRYFCNLCGEVPLGTVPDVYTHIRGRNHSKKVQDLMDLYHPTYCNYADSEDSEDDEEASESSDEESDSMLEEFKKTYVDLEIDELLEVEYPQNETDWEYMLTVDNDRYFCNLCGEVPLGTAPNVYIHIRGRNHSKKVQDLMDLHYPTYCNYADSEDWEDDEEASESADEESDYMLESKKEFH